ncbi:hypothetical protein [Dinghuibacter silviterrae]|uniref:Cytochrome c domain-containing protein n=1 Tax=Dinghuibacter silviterrae TaxID=1539049 RepID=A0A4R8DQH1_9BACT|nr:hypothetical protein [Dinghuibacter silviterrae]TDW99370.1 hypothetical protein EDB95_0380 [Dinghuibacter silviterrae]
MKKNTSTVMAMLFVVAFLTYRCNNNTMTGQDQGGAFQNHRDSIPTKQQYPYPLFVLSHDYPTTATPLVNPPWHQALQGQPISSSNFIAYMDSLKSYVAPNVMPFFTDNPNWTSARYGWFNEPWLGSQREAILGTYLGNGNPANMFKSLKVDESGYVLVLYDSLAAYTVGQIWGKTGQKVNLLNNATQFPEGSVIVKLAFSNINYPEWPVMEGAQTLNVYDTIPTVGNPAPGYQMRKVSFFQMDVIVKDSSTAPKTGWVYSTFVYDKDTTGSFWDKMVPLGAMWGNDPGVNSPTQPPYPPLYETVIYTGAPEYSKETLGWGGRLSGPNDGAVAQEAVDITTGQVYQNLALSSCMSCHSPAQDTFTSFLLPGPFPTSDTLFVYTPGSPNWNLWFRDNWGNVPFNEGQVAMDYDMVMAFKSVPAWEAAQSSGQNSLLKANLEAVNRFRRHKTQSRFWH